MAVSDKALKNHDELFDGVNFAVEGARPLTETDADYLDIFLNFAFEEVWDKSRLDKKTRMLIILASMIAQNTRPRYKVFLAAALKIGILPEEVKELVYHCVPYCGIARVFDIIYDTNEVLTEYGYTLPTQTRTLTTRENRYEKGLAVQKFIFGDIIDKMRESAPQGQLHIQDFLSANCFGDFYTRKGLDVKLRELITFSILVSLGGCEPQVKGHVQGNANVGNGKEVLVDAVTQLLPYIGYPRTLNALSCINAVLPD